MASRPPFGPPSFSCQRLGWLPFKSSFKLLCRAILQSSKATERPGLLQALSPKAPSRMLGKVDREREIMGPRRFSEGIGESTGAAGSFSLAIPHLANKTIRKLFENPSPHGAHLHETAVGGSELKGKLGPHATHFSSKTDGSVSLVDSRDCMNSATASSKSLSPTVFELRLAARMAASFTMASSAAPGNPSHLPKSLVQTVNRKPFKAWRRSRPATVRSPPATAAPGGEAFRVARLLGTPVSGADAP